MSESNEKHQSQMADISGYKHRSVLQTKIQSVKSKYFPLLFHTFHTLPIASQVYSELRVVTTVTVVAAK